MRWNIGYASRPFQNIPPCGDGWISIEIGTTHRLMLADGIGHGRSAYEIVEGLREHLHWICRRSSRLMELDDCLLSLHQFLQKQSKQGQAAVALLDLEHEAKTIRSLIAGNVVVRYASTERCTQCLSLPGMVGGRLPTKLNITSLAMKAGGLLSIASDGLESRGLDDYLVSRCRAGIAGQLDMQTEAEAMLENFGKISDDASCALITIQERTR